jgi:hypothetical protein
LLGSLLGLWITLGKQLGFVVKTVSIVKCKWVVLPTQLHSYLLGIKLAAIATEWRFKLTIARDRLLIQKIQQLAPQRKAEVADFVEFLRTRDERQAAADRMTANLAKLDVLNLPPLSNEEINEEIAAARAERRAKQSGSS